MTHRDSVLRPMSGRSGDEEHRAATPLELFYDLVIVVAVAVAAASLHHGIAEDHIFESVMSYIAVFFAIWWAWMSFTWFAAAYDNDDVPYRIAVFVQMAGAVIIAAGIGRAFDIEHPDWSLVGLGYVVMRTALVFQWLRAARDDPERRGVNLRFAGSVAVLQVLWVLALVAVPAELFQPIFIALVIAELAAPIWSSRGHEFMFHNGHIAERYGLLTIIVLGESVLAGAIAFGSAADGSFGDVELVALAVGSLLLVFAMWWLYFERSSEDLLTSAARAYEWGYGHYFIWAAAAAVGAGIAIAVDVNTHHAEVGLDIAGWSVAVPVAIYLIGIWVLHDVPRPQTRARKAMTPIAVVLVLLTPLTQTPVLLAGVVVVGLLVAKLATTPRSDGPVIA